MSSTITIRLEDSSKAQLEILSQSTNRSKSWLASQAINDYLKKETAEILSIQDALEESNKPDTKKYSNEEVVKWMMSWGTENEYDFPR
jgi:RHH-type transcriptional regulator, rel operon repressor / antitoxin RelB